MECHVTRRVASRDDEGVSGDKTVCCNGEEELPRSPG